MFLLDTNVVSELRRARPHKGVVNWLTTVPEDALFVSAVTAGEVQAGIEIARQTDQAKAREIEEWLDAVTATYRILAVDAAAFRACARLLAGKSKAALEDALIAATALTRGLTVATRNVSDFRGFGVKLFDPFGFKG